MTRKHFQAIADVIRKGAKEPEERSFWAHEFADLCAEFNPNFDRSRFLKACGVEVSTPIP